jgi:hypothetical protein
MLALFMLIDCTKEKDNGLKSVQIIDIDTISFFHSMKGWELYSWPSGNDWNYSILIGTNRLKSYEEVTTNRIIASGKDSLMLLLNKLPENENIFWIGKGWLARCWGGNYGNLSLPGDSIINEILEYCIQKKLALSFSD